MSLTTRSDRERDRERGKEKGANAGGRWEASPAPPAFPLSVGQSAAPAPLPAHDPAQHVGYPQPPDATKGTKGRDSPSRPQSWSSMMRLSDAGPDEGSDGGGGHGGR